MTLFNSRVIFSLIAFGGALSSCQPRSYNTETSSIVRGNRGNQEALASEADGGLFLPPKVKLTQLGSYLQNVSNEVKAALADSSITSQIESLRNEFMNKGQALMVRSFILRSDPAFCEQIRLCKGIVVALEAYSPIQSENINAGTITIRRANQAGSSPTFVFSPQKADLGEMAFRYGTPTSLNVFIPSIIDQSWQLSSAFNTKAAQSFVAGIAKNAGVSPEQFEVISAISAVAGSTCRSATEPCRENFFHLVIRKPNSEQITDFGTLYIRHYEKQGSSKPDFIKFSPIGRTATGTGASFELKFSSPVSVSVLAKTTVDVPDYVNVATAALLGDANFSKFQQTLMNQSQALMVKSISSAIPENSGSRVVKYELESYSPIDGNKGVGFAAVTLSQNAAPLVVLQK